MKTNFKLEIAITVDTEDAAETDIVEKNVKLLPEMAETLGLFTDGAVAELISISHNIKRVKPRKKRQTTKA